MGGFNEVSNQISQSLMSTAHRHPSHQIWHTLKTLCDEMLGENNYQRIMTTIKQRYHRKGTSELIRVKIMEQVVK